MSSPQRLSATGFTHQGAVRASNEDTIAVGNWVRSEPMSEPQAFDLVVGARLICLVADGMSGHPAGDVASQGAAQHLTRRAAQATDEAAVAKLLHEANDALFALMEKSPAWSGMGTTVAGVSVAPSSVVVFNVGDSRVYRIEAGRLVQLSTDDTPGPKLPDGRTAVYTQPIITQVLGGYGPAAPPEEQIMPHVLSEPAADGARYLLCSDGLSDLLTRDEIEAGLAADDRTSVQALFEAAMARGGRDNISIIMLDLRRS